MSERINHKWEDNICLNCGLNRERKYWKLLMAITNQPPYDHYMTGVDWFYWKEHKLQGTFDRPNCNVISLKKVVRHYKKQLNEQPQKS